MEFAMLICAAVIVACIVSNRVVNRFGIPTVLVFMALGMVFGSEGIFKIVFDDFTFAEQLCSTALVFIMFYGGFGTNFHVARPVLPKAVTMATLGVVFTAGLTGLFCHLVLGMSLQEGLLLGAVVGSTDAASVFSILRSKSLDLRDGTASLLEVESGSNDPFSYMMTMIILGWMGGGGESVVLMLVKQIGWGLLFGIGIGFIVIYVLKSVRFEIQGIDNIMMIALVLFAFAGPMMLGGNGYLSVYLLGIIVGNQKYQGKIEMIHFFDGVNRLAQILIFFLLGLLVFPSRLVPMIVPAVIVFLGLTFIARPLTTIILMLPFRKRSWRQNALVSFAGLRGAASIVFAIMVTINSVYPKDDIYNIVFCIALLSISFQGLLLPYAAQKLDMVDESQDVMRTFSDYQDEQQLMLVQIKLEKGHKYIGKKISDLNLSMLLVLIKRDGESLVPRGNIVLQEGDLVVLSGESFQDGADMILDEMKIESGNECIGQTIKDLPPFENSLIVLIRRASGATVIPKGETKIKEGDILVMSKGN